MADEIDAIQAIKKFGNQYQHVIKWWPAFAGDGNGNVNTSQAYWYLARYPLESSPTHEVFNDKINLTDRLRIIVGYTIYHPNRVEVIDVFDERLEIVDPLDNPINPGAVGYSHVFPHWVNHQYLGADSGYINWRQVSALGVFPTSPPSLSVQIWPGTIPRPGTDVNVAYQSFDLTSHVPVSGARYVLISYDSTGAVVATDGTANPGGFSALTNADIPATPAGNWRACAVVLYAGQTAIVESTSEVDFLDLRFPEETTAGSITPDQISGSTAQYQYIVAGAGPTFTPAWSGGGLNITTGKTLRATGTLTLTPSSDGLTLTVPATGTAALIDVANTFSLNNDFFAGIHRPQMRVGVGSTYCLTLDANPGDTRGSVVVLDVAGTTPFLAVNAKMLQYGDFHLPNVAIDSLLMTDNGTYHKVVPITNAAGVLLNDGAGSFSFISLAITDDTTTNATMYPTWVTATSGTQAEKVSSTKLNFNPATGTLSTIAGSIFGTAGAGYLDFAAQSVNPAAPGAGVVRFHAATTQGFTRFEQDNEAPTNLILGRDNVFIAKNTSGSNIAAGKPVYVTGSTGNVPNIALAKADSSTTLPVVGMTLDPINNNNFGQVMVVGIISGIDTSTFLSGDQLWVSPTTAGGLVKVRPVYPNLVARIGSVLVSGVGNGSLLIDIAPFLGGLESGTTATGWTGAGTVNAVTGYRINGGATLNTILVGNGTNYIASTNTLNLTGNATLSGTNTGDQSLAGLVPYSGATSDVDLGAHKITANSLDLSATSNQVVFALGAPAKGFLTWAPTTVDKTITLPDATGTVALTSNLPVGANPTASVGLTAVNGSAATWMRSDGAPALSVSIVPTWSGVHTFGNTTDATSVSTGSIVTSGGIGVAKAIYGGSTLTLNLNAAAVAPAAGTSFYLEQADSTPNIAEMDAFSQTSGFIFRRANTTAASPSALAIDDVMGFFGGRGYGSTGYSLNRATILFRASQAWTDSNQGTYIQFQTTPNNSTTAAAAVTIGNDKSLSVVGGVNVGGDTGGVASNTTISNTTNATVTNTYLVKGGQAANTVNTGWIKIYIGTNAAWIPYWQNATP